MKKEILRVRNLVKNYHDAPDSRNIIDGLDLTLNYGDFLCILGPSGCGKTTFIRCIAGFEDYEGTIEIDGKEVRGPGIDRVMVFQDFNQLFPWKTVEKNIQYPLKKNGVTDKEELKRISDEHLELVGLKGYEKFYPHQLSGGMKQRVAIAKGLALKPKVILMDEPFASLDAMTRNRLQKELLKIKEKEDVTVIFITHNIQEAVVLGSRVVMMSRQGGQLKIDVENTIPKPVTPASPGYGEMWNKFNSALEAELTDSDE